MREKRHCCNVQSNYYKRMITRQLKCLEEFNFINIEQSPSDDKDEVHNSSPFP